jgi:hypothetical protein
MWSGRAADGHDRGRRLVSVVTDIKSRALFEASGGSLRPEHRDPGTKVTVTLGAA